jgi:prepilin-type N-terminal cleavage/methylation domain-containing protein/prepilin-type processing-associated H-X9-DG protein
MNESETRKRHRSRPAFTLIEVLVVIVIISTVLALLGPKLVQTAEAARRTQCRNNLSQIVLAIHSYEGLHGVLPPGTINPHGPIKNVPDGYHVSWTIQLLPFLEQRNYYELFDPLFGAYNGVLNGGGSTISVYTCPSSGVQIASTGAAVSSYAACYGDSETGIDSTNNGAFFMNSSLTHHDIRDGSANTIFIGEKLGSPSDLGWVSGTNSTLRNTNGGLNNPEDLTMEFATIRNGGFGSAHPNGSIFAFGDGSVRMLRNSVDLGLFRKLGNRHDGQLIYKDF